MTTLVILALAGSAVLSMLLTVVVRALASRVRFVDEPAGRKAHAKPIALGGGVAILLSIAVPLLAGVIVARFVDKGAVPDWVPDIIVPHLPGIASKFDTVLALLGGALVLHVVGLLDDRRPLGPWLKLACQVAVATMLAAGFGIRLFEALGETVSVVATVIWLVLIINAFNFLDNVDGLSAGVAAIAASIIAVTAMTAGQIFVPIMAWTVAGAAAGFLVFNFPPASIFMGDAGSMVLGLFLGLLTVLTTYYDPDQQLRPVGVLVPLVVLAVPLYDVISVCVIRIRSGDSPFRGDRRHFSHRLMRRGMSERFAVLTIYLATAATGMLAILLPRADNLMAGIILTQCVCVVLIIAILEAKSPGPTQREPQEHRP